MDQVLKEKIIKALQDRKVSQPCPRCQATGFDVVGQTSVALNDNPSVATLGGLVVPAALIACSQCGFITLHALGSLDLMPKEINQ
jgi:hypothetical protein